MERGKLYVAVNCTNCGKTEGTPVSERGNRCSNCGRYAEGADNYCVEHGVDIDRLTGYDHCPRCRERHRVEQLEQERMARRADPNMHPTVDAPRR